MLIQSVLGGGGLGGGGGGEGGEGYILSRASATFCELFEVIRLFCMAGWVRLHSVCWFTVSRFVTIILFFFWAPHIYLWGSPFLGEIFAYVTVLNPSIEVDTFRIRGYYSFLSAATWRLLAHGITTCPWFCMQMLVTFSSFQSVWQHLFIDSLEHRL